METEALEALLLSGCSKLEHIPGFGKNMKRLVHLYVDGTRIKKLPENLGEMCDLRNLDASGTFIKVLPSFIYGLRKLRLLNVNRCKLSFKLGCFLNPSSDTLSSALKEVDLSYCNLSVVPDGIGLLGQLITLDLSGNEFVSLPASIGLLSRLRMLCLNNCKRLRLLPKLSLVDEDMDYGPRNRFNYYVSTEGVDVSKFQASRHNNIHPTVSCLGCPKLAADKRGGCLAEKILNSYLELRTKYWMTPEAVFEIVGTGGEIPSGFVQPGSEGLILEGPWIGVAIFAVIPVHHIDGYAEAKYMITAHIHLGGKHWKISVPINSLVTDSETQLVFYWTVADDLQRIVGSSQKSNFGVSFSVDPEDSNLQVTKFGVHFIHKEYISCLKRRELTMFKIEIRMSSIAYYGRYIHKHIAEFEDNAYIDHRIRKIADFISNYGRQGSLDGIYQITKGVLEINREYFGVRDKYKELNYEKFVYYCYVIRLGVSVLYKDFVQSIKDINDGWLSVKLALEQIVVKSRGDSYSYKEMLQQLNDIEAAQSVGFSDMYMTMFESVFMKTSDSIGLLFQVNFALGTEKFTGKLLKEDELAKVSIITTASVLCMMGDFKLLEAMKQTSMTSLWLHLIKAFTDKKHVKDGQFIVKELSNCELQISDFYENGILVQELMTKMGRCSCFTKENEKEMAIVIDNLEKNIHKVSSTIQEMGSHAQKYSHYLEKAKKHVKHFSKFSRNDNIISMLPLFNKS